MFNLKFQRKCGISTWRQGKKEIAACAESRFFPLFARNFMYSLMYSLLKIAVSRFLGKIIAIFFCPCLALLDRRLVRCHCISGN